MRAKVYLAAAMVVALVLLGIFWHARLTADFWPPDRSAVGPNLVASVIQWALVLIVASLVYPPLRKAIDRWATAKFHSAHDALHSKLDHIIRHHPDIPEMEDKP